MNLDWYFIGKMIVWAELWFWICILAIGPAIETVLGCSLRHGCFHV